MGVSGPNLLGGRLAVSAKLVEVVLWLNVRVTVLAGRFPCNFRLGGMYSFFAGTSPFSEPPLELAGRLWTTENWLGVGLPTINCWRTESTIVLRTPFFVISRFKSALAASVTDGPVKSSPTETRAHSRTVPSVSSNVSTRTGRYGLSGKVGCKRRTCTRVSIAWKS